MATLVFAAGTPHGPSHPREVEEQGPSSPLGALYRRVAEALERARPDLIVFFDSDHFTNFFLDNMPAFCVGIVPRATGPAETFAEVPTYTVPVHEACARALLDFALRAEFDVASKEEMVLDHSILVPLHFLTPRMDVPIVPVYVRGLAPPLPLARRCLALGQMVRRFVEQWPGSERVAILASGSFSLEVGGPRWGWRDEAWMRTVTEALARGEPDTLVAQATTERMLAAGNVAGELLNWIALLGALGDTPPKPLFLLPQAGDAFVAWDLEAAPAGR